MSNWMSNISELVSKIIGHLKNFRHECSEDLSVLFLVSLNFIPLGWILLGILLEPSLKLGVASFLFPFILLFTVIVCNRPLYDEWVRCYHMCKLEIQEFRFKRAFASQKDCER